MIKIQNKKGAALRPLVIGLMLVLAFSLALISFFYNFLNINNPSSAVFDSDSNSTINNRMANLSNTINTASNSINDTKAILESESKPGVTTYLFLIFEGAFSIPKAMLNVVISGLFIFSIIFTEIFGSQFGFIFQIIILGIIITIIFLIIRSIRTGDSG